MPPALISEETSLENTHKSSQHIQYISTSQSKEKRDRQTNRSIARESEDLCVMGRAFQHYKKI